MTLKRAGSTFITEKEVFLQSTGDNGFAPTALAVHPVTGDLFISIRGPGTRGGGYSVPYPAGGKIRARGRADLEPGARALDWREDYVKQAAMGDAPARLRALIEMRRHLGRLKAADVLAAVRANWEHEDRHVSRAAADLIAVLPQQERHQLRDDAKQPRQQATWCLGCAATDPGEVLTFAVPLLTGPINE